MDSRIVEFCLSLPDSVYVNNKESRRLVRCAMKGLVPDPILSTNRRGFQAADVIIRLQHQIKELECIKEKYNKSSLAKEFLNIKKMNQFINTLNNPCQTTIFELYAFARALSVFLFLEKF